MERADGYVPGMGAGSGTATIARAVAGLKITRWRGAIQLKSLDLPFISVPSSLELQWFQIVRQRLILLSNSTKFGF